jgi:hypothetical protein
MKLWQWIFWIVVFSAGCNAGRSETLAQLRNRVNTKLTNTVPLLVARQNTYFAAHTNYFQGLITFSSIPAHTTTTVADSLADRLTFHPTDQSETWASLFPEFNIELFAAAAKIDVYDGPSGKGWYLTVSVKHNGVIYQRQKWWGAENHDFDWAIYDPAQ